MYKYQSSIIGAYALAKRARLLATCALAGTFVMAQVTPSLATIDNTATAKGATTAAGALNPYTSASKSVPVQPGAPALTVSKTAGVPTTHTVNGVTGTFAGDTITYTYVVTNSGNVTINNVQPTDTGPKFNGTAGTATLASYTLTGTTGTGSGTGTANASGATANLVPGGTATFTAVYTLSAQDVYEAAGLGPVVTNSATATGTPANGTLATVTPATATDTIPAAPNLCITKTAAISGGHTAAQLGDTVTYTYAVQNCGNVTMFNVQVVDQHGTPAVQVPIGAGGITGETLTTPSATGATASTDGTANNGIWSTLGAGATVTFTWAHIVTQAEIDHG